MNLYYLNTIDFLLNDQLMYEWLVKTVHETLIENTVWVCVICWMSEEISLKEELDRIYMELWIFIYFELSKSKMI